MATGGIPTTGTGGLYPHRQRTHPPHACRGGLPPGNRHRATGTVAGTGLVSQEMDGAEWHRGPAETLMNTATSRLALVSPAGNLPSLKPAVDAGADAVYIGFRDATNARHFAGLNFDADTMAQGIAYARSRDCKVFLALNT